MAIVAVAFLLRQAVEWLVGPGLPPYITFAPAVMLAALFCGLKPGLLATALSALAAMYWILPTVGRFGFVSAAEAVGFGMFICLGVLMSITAELYHRARRRATAFEMELARQESQERRRVEEQLRQNEGRLRAIFDNAAMGIVEVDSESRFISANAKAAEILGCKPDGIIGRTVHDLTAPEDRPRSDELNAQLRDGRRNILDYEKRYLRGDGTPMWVHVTVSAVRDERGRFVRGVGTFEDISERKAAEEALRTSEERLRMAIESGDLGTWDLDPRTGKVDASDRSKTLLGLPVQAGMTHQMFLDRLHPDDRQRVDDLVRQALDPDGSGEYETEFRIIRPDGAERWMFAAGRAFFVIVEGRRQAVRFMGTVRDITERRRAQEAIRLGEEQLRQAVRVAGLGIFDHNQVADTVQWSPMMREICGFDAVGPANLADWLEVVHPDDRPRIAVAIAKAHAPSGDGLYAVEHRILRRDGQVRWLSIRSQTFFAGPPGERHPVRTIGAVLDITESKRVEEVMSQIAHDLARSNQDLAQFAYVASHDLKEPLRMITGFLGILKQRQADKLDSEGREFVDFALDGSHRMQELIDDLLAYSRAGREETPEPTSLEQVLEGVCRNLSHAIAESAAVITHDPLPTVMSKPTSMTQVLQNLLSNAIKFRGERPPRIHIGARPEQEHWLLWVKDNGIGLDPAQAERIFMLFQRLHPREEYPGTGIGLAVCKRIIERSGGRIWVESVPGEGSTFFFTLPAQ